MEERIAVVDEENRFIRWEGRRAIHEHRLLHRSVYILVFNTKGELLTQLRHRDKQTYPLYWDISVAGHVCAEDYHAGPDDDVDQVYRLTGERELAEELGITAPMRRLGHFGPTATHYEQIRLFGVQSDGPITIQEAEVEAVQWVSPAAFRAMLNDPEARITESLRRFGVWGLDNNCW
jgi:isopentenyl-diphosphate delta-isomerase